MNFGKFGNWKTPNILWDICRFTLSTLKKAGESFNLKIAKGDFNHNLMKSWGDLEKYKYKQPNGEEGWKAYLKKDVLVLRDLFIAFNNKMFDVFKIYPVNLGEKIKGSIGVIADDIIAGIYTIIALMAYRIIFY